MSRNDILYSHHGLVDLRHRFREITACAAGREPDEYRVYLRQMVEMGLKLCIAEHQGRIIGTLGYMTEPGRTGITRNRDFLSAIEAVGIDPNTVQLRALIYVAKEFRGQGIINELEARVNEVSLAHGFLYYAGFAYDSEEIFNWGHRHGDAVSLGMDDPMGSGLPVTLLPISRPEVEGTGS